MAWDDPINSTNNNDENGKKPRRGNPWGTGRGNQPVQGPWGGQRRGGGGGGGYGGGNGQEPPDLDEMLQRMRDNMGGMFPENFNGGKLIAIGITIIALLWLASGIYIVQPGEQSVIQRFGQWERTQALPGIGYHLPWPVETHTIVNVDEVRRLSIGFDEALNGNRRFTPGGATGSSGKRDIPDESLMLTSDRNIVDIDLVVQWDIEDAKDFLFNIEGQENTIKKVAESAIREVVGQTQMFPIITTERSSVAQRTRVIIQANLDEYESGVNISQVLIETAEVHPEVQGAFQDVQSAKQDAEDIQNRAEAYREEILPRARGEAIQLVQQAEGYRQSTIARARGDAGRFQAVLEAYRSGEDVTRRRIYIETLEEVLGRANKIILDQQDGSAQGVVPFLPLNELNRQQRPQTQ